MRAINTALFYNGRELRDDDLLSTAGIEGSTFLYMTTDEEAETLSAKRPDLNSSDPATLPARFAALLQEGDSRGELCSVAKWSIDSIAKKLLDAGAFRSLIPAIFHRVAYSQDPAVIYELLRLLVALRDRSSTFPLLTRIGTLSAAGQFPSDLRGDGDGSVPRGISMCAFRRGLAAEHLRGGYSRGEVTNRPGGNIARSPREQRVLSALRDAVPAGERSRGGRGGERDTTTRAWLVGGNAGGGSHAGVQERADAGAAVSGPVSGVGGRFPTSGAGPADAR